MTIRAAVVGCGFQGRLHLEHLRAIEGVELVGLCELDPQRRAAVAREFEVEHAYADHRDLLEAHDLELLTVCTMPSTHRAITIDALDAGANVLCEKPFATSTADAADMVAAARRTGRLLSVGFNLRHSTAAQAIHGFVERGELGRPVCARGWMLADDVPWWGKHYVRRLSGGGALNSTAVHVIDLVTWLAGHPEPTTASASMTTLYPGKRGAGTPSPEMAEAYDVEDLLFGHLRFRGGFWMSVEGSWTWDGSGWNYSFELVGDRAQAHLAPLRFSGERDGTVQDLTGDATGDTDFPSSVARELLDVVDAVREDREPLVRAEQALVVQAIVDALYRSAGLGHEVQVEVPAVVDTLPPE
jgi:predicted dehydrogenase